VVEPDGGFDSFVANCYAACSAPRPGDPRPAPCPRASS